MHLGRLALLFGVLAVIGIVAALRERAARGRGR
jgi:crotonobetainyl-CoA:carnitine CoA-transferase CaiB-like acyl-CoA transferase